ncbi:ATP-binding protein [Brevundimonas nasdae]|uniref:ATP-binding protein n=1 Tax=Brevundimonas nasdae TaxID=172043 RepID=UPI003F6911CA
MISCHSGLSRKLALRMALVAVCSVVLTVAGFLAIQVFILKQPILLDTRDYVAIVSFCILGVVMGSVAANHLARQIVSPVRRIAAAARRISENDLSARVDEPDETLGEVQELARDFNLMAVRLDRLAKERKQWRDAISHELRTPLMILRGHLQGGLDGIYPNDDRLLSLALSQVETLTRVMGDLAAMEDAEDPGLQAHPVAVDRLLSDIRSLMDPPLRRAGFVVDWRIAPVAAVVDETRIRQAVVALVQNLLVHATPGPAKVQLQQNDDRLVLTVADSGPGIDAALSETIFEPFKRGPTQASGCGVGLAMARYAADAHGGSVQLRPSDLGGSAFVVTVPLRG